MKKDVQSVSEMKILLWFKENVFKKLKIARFIIVYNNANYVKKDIILLSKNLCSQNCLLGS